MVEDRPKRCGKTIPGIMTAVAALITAIAGLILAMICRYVQMRAASTMHQLGAVA